MKNRTQRKNLFLSFTVLIIIFAAAYFWLIFGNVYPHSRERYLNDRRQLVAKVASQVDNYFLLMDDITLQIIYSDAIHEALTLANQDPSDLNYFDSNIQARKECAQAMSAYISITNQISRASIFGIQGDYCSIGAPRRNLNTSDILKLEVLPKARALDGSLCIQGPAPDPLSSQNEKLYYSASRIMKRGYAAYGYAEVQQSYETLDQICSLSPTIRVYLFDEQGALLYPALSQSEISEEAYSSQYEKARENLTFTDSCLFESKGEVISSVRLKNKFILMAIENRKDLFKDLYHMQNTTTIFALLISVFCILAVYYISKYTSQSVENLTTAVKNIDFHTYVLPLSPQKCTTHETKQLAEATIQMLQKLQQYAALSSEAQARELQATIVALQSQLNPHFINNTLAAISSLAMESENLNIVHMCSHLSHMLTYAQEVNTPATLKTEITYTRHYLSLMKYRYSDLLEYSVDIAAPLLEVKVPRLILQPLIENCIYHGFNSDRTIKRIEIKGELTGNCWKISIRDNGCGFSASSLEAIAKGRKEIRDLLDQGQASYIHSDELGILNTFSRLYILQKENTIFEIHSSASGATVIIGGAIHD